jgi:excisionase family DNA binding protein
MSCLKRFPVTERLTLSIEEAAEALGIGRGLAYELARTGGLPVLKLGRRIVVPKAQLEAMVASEDWRHQIKDDGA